MALRDTVRGPVSGGHDERFIRPKNQAYVARPRPSGGDGESLIMNATATIAPAGPQYMRALERANKVRLARAELKRRISTAEIDITDVLIDCPWEAESMAVADLLLSQRRWGQTRCRKFLAQLPMSEKKTLGSLTDRQRQTLVAMLRGVGAAPQYLPGLRPPFRGVRRHPRCSTCHQHAYRSEIRCDLRSASVRRLPSTARPPQPTIYCDANP